MNVTDYAFGIAAACWLGSLAQFAIVLGSSWRRQRGRA